MTIIRIDMNEIYTLVPEVPGSHTPLESVHVVPYREAQDRENPNVALV